MANGSYHRFMLHDSNVLALFSCALGIVEHVNVVFQFHISCCLMVRCFLYSLSSMKDDANIYNNVITCIFWCKILGRADALNCAALQKF